MGSKFFLLGIVKDTIKKIEEIIPCICEYKIKNLLKLPLGNFLNKSDKIKGQIVNSYATKTVSDTPQLIALYNSEDVFRSCTVFSFEQS